MRFHKFFYSILLIFFTLFSLTAAASDRKDSLKYEWRAVWIATVNNIDWPSSPNLSTAEQKSELLAYFDLCKELNMNAVVLQIRPCADAFYRSELEPWSIYLTGDQDKAPSPFYDPLAFAVEQAHKRGLELHAWINPYRLTQDTANLAEVSREHIYRAHPEWFVVHGKKAYFDPGVPACRGFIASVVREVVANYNVDGIHLDDYFYPDNDFNDTLSFRIYNRGYSADDKFAWRRENVDMTVDTIMKTVKRIKPYVKFGISPYAVWRNKRDDERGSDTKSYGYTNYDNLHSDVLMWMERKMVDYMLPQLYFNIGYEMADFAVLEKWWRESAAGLPLYAGLGTYRLDENAKIPAYRSAEEIGRQIDMIRENGGYSGFCFFSAKNLLSNRLNIVELLKERFPHKALPAPILPADAKLGTPAAPVKCLYSQVTVKGSNEKEIHLSWKQIGEPYLYVIYKSPKGEKLDTGNPANIVDIVGTDSYICTGENLKDCKLYITALSRHGVESQPKEFVRQNVLNRLSGLSD